MNSILNDSIKFSKINNDSLNSIKAEANELITALNSVENNLKLNKIIVDFCPGYLHGNIKTLKPVHPLHPIISQCPTPRYQLAKSLNEIISPYIDSRYILTPTDDFLI